MQESTSPAQARARAERPLGRRALPIHHTPGDGREADGAELRIPSAGRVPRRCLLYGCGGIGIVALEVATAAGLSIEAFVDDDPECSTFAGRRVRPGLLLDPRFSPARDERLLICIGDNARRAELSRRFPGILATAIHPSALVSPSARVGAGTMLFHASRVQAAATVGDGVIMNTGASVDHQCAIGDYVHLAPNTTLCGYVQVGEGATIGAGAVVLPRRRIGRRAIVGAGSVVTEDVPQGATVVGSPARVIRQDGRFVNPGGA